MPSANTPKTDVSRLLQAEDRFIALWGEMGSTWGIPRTMAEIHALLYIVGEPLNTDEVMQRLGVSRGNASMTLRALLDWGLISRIHARGDRKEYFKAEQDVWRLFTTIVRERKRREFDPLLSALDECRTLTDVDRSGSDPAIDSHNARLDNMLHFIHTLNAIAERFVSPSGKGLLTAAKLLGKIS
jgi:HTH-type transcriptional regulator, glycine betaine synthesis regulator